MIRAIDLFSEVPILRAKELPVKTDSCPEDLILRFCSTSDPSNFTNHSEKFHALGDMLRILYLIYEVYMSYLCSRACFRFQKLQYQETQKPKEFHHRFVLQLPCFALHLCNSKKAS